MAGIRTEAFIADIKENLFDDNKHATLGINHSAFANNLEINVPQAGGNPTVELNRSSFPATIQERTDTNLQYTMGEFTTDPFKIPNKDVAELKYNKRQSIMRQHIDAINDRIGDVAGFNYATDTTARQVLTSGAADALALAPSATGTRNAFTKEDLRKAAAIMDNDRVPKAGRTAIIDSDMYWQLFDDDTMVNSRTIGAAKLPEGVVDRLFGFDIITRSKIVVFDNANAKKAVGAAGAATDNLGAVCFQRNSISWAQTSINVMVRDESMNPEYYATIMSALVRYGSSICRTDEKGIVSIVQQ